MIKPQAVALMLLMLMMLPVSQVLAQEPEIIVPTEYFLLMEDNHEYAQPQSDRSGWSRHDFSGLPLSDSIFWVQYDFDVSTQPTQAMGVLISLLGSYDAYWDGTYIGSNGIVGDTKSSEVPGDIDKVILLPTELIHQGKHTLSLRVSSQHRLKSQLTGSFWTFISDYDYLIQIPYKRASQPMVMSGALLFVALYTLFLYFTALRQSSYLAFSLLCLTILSLIIAESWRGLWGYTYDWQIPRLWVVLCLSTAIGMLLVWFFAWFFALSRRSKVLWLSGAVVSQLVILVSSHGYDNRSLYVFLVGALSACGICLQAWKQKRTYAAIMFMGLLLFLAPLFVSTYSYMDHYFFLLFGALMGLMLYTLARTMGTKQNQLAQSQITASRLELELVKRQLQPHFILNTLTAIEEWIEESPTTAVKFIQALADEFRYMADMSSHKLIRLQDEIDLCRSHLKVMSYRTNVSFSLHADAPQTTLLMPPGVVLTFLENAISHNHYKQGDVEFVLVQHSLGDGRQQLQLTVPVTPKTVKNTEETGINLGIGNQYIEARMKESFGEYWSMTTQLEANQWQVLLVFPSTTVDGKTS